MQRISKFIDWLILPNSTLELGYLNKIVGDYLDTNDGSIEALLVELTEYDWKYHKDKAQMFIDIYEMIRKENIYKILD